MKLVVAVIQGRDAPRLIEAIVAKGVPGDQARQHGLQEGQDNTMPEKNIPARG